MSWQLRKLAVESPAGSTKKLGPGNNVEEEWEDLLPESPDFLVETQILGHVLVENFIYASTRNSGGKLNKTLSNNSSASILHRNMITWVAFMVKSKSTFFPTKTRMRNYGERSAGVISFVIYIYSYLLSQFSKQLILESKKTKEEHRGNRQVDK